MQMLLEPFRAPVAHFQSRCPAGSRAAAGSARQGGASMRCGIVGGAAALTLIAAHGRRAGRVVSEQRCSSAAGGSSSTRRSYSFDVGATAWLTERWGLGAWTSFPCLVGESETNGGLLFNPAVRYQRRLRRGRSLHMAAGPGFIASRDAPARFVFLPCTLTSCTACPGDTAGRTRCHPGPTPFNEGRGVSPGDTTHSCRSMPVAGFAQRRPGREPRRHPR